jgi:hypothetical protein
MNFLEKFHTGEKKPEEEAEKKKKWRLQCDKWEVKSSGVHITVRLSTALRQSDITAVYVQKRGEKIHGNGYIPQP